MMAKLREEEWWAQRLELFAQHRAQRSLSEDGCYFVKVLRRDFAAAAAAASARNSGHRGVNAAILVAALRSLLERRSVTVHTTAATEVVGNVRKQVDLTFECRGEWNVEVKVGLEFNTLAAAAVEGLVFRRARSRSKFLVVSMYSKFPGDPSSSARGILKHLGLSHTVSGIHVLTNRDLEEMGAWSAFFAGAVNKLCESLPDARVGAVTPRGKPGVRNSGQAA